MKETKWYEMINLVAYILMLIVCICLNMFSGQELNIANIAVNAAMFIITAVIFIGCEVRCFGPAKKAAIELTDVAAKISKDARRTDELLWNSYCAQEEELFEDGVLRDRYLDFVLQATRAQSYSISGLSCDIEEHISYDLMDDIMHRNLLNQVPGVMTGLGILGTFIGLVIGLSGFSTGSTSEIAGSIKPLMDGIKVAFHTSIYGMIFSLVFNYSLKRRAEDAQEALRSFVTTYKNYVHPGKTSSSSMAAELSAVLAPQFDRLEKTISDFAYIQTKNQTDAISALVAQFIDEMNRSLSDSFRQLSDSMERLTRDQATHEKGILDMIDGADSAVSKLNDILARSDTLYINLSQYIEDLQRVHELTEKSISSLRELSENISFSYDNIEKGIGKTAEAIEDLNESVKKVASGEKKRRRGFWG